MVIFSKRIGVLLRFFFCLRGYQYFSFFRVQEVLDLCVGSVSPWNFWVYCYSDNYILGNETGFAMISLGSVMDWSV